MGQAVVIPLPAPVDGLIRLPVCLVGPYRLQAASGHTGRRLLRRNSRRHSPQHRRAVDRICPKPAFADMLDAAVESYSEWDVERSAWKGELPEIPGLTFVDDLLAYLERKLFTLNSGHAICAYLGYLLFGAAAALRFDCPKDAQSVELQAKIRTDGAESALALYTGLTPDHPLFGRILDIYRALAVAAKA